MKNMFADPSLLIFVIIFFEYISRKLYLLKQNLGVKNYVQLLRPLIYAIKLLFMGLPWWFSG